MKFRILSFLSLCLFILTSCNFSEDIYINEDGSGKLSFKFDGSDLMALAGDEIAKESEEKYDTVMNFKDFLIEKKDSIATLSQAEQERLKQLERFAMRMTMDMGKKDLLMDMYTDFESVAELDNMMTTFSKLGGASTEGLGAASAPELGEGTTVEYKFDGNIFRRRGYISNEAVFQQALDSIGKMETFFSSSTYKLNYHFPRPIATVSKEQALFSEDRKSVTVGASFMEVMKDPTLLDVEIVLKD